MRDWDRLQVPPTPWTSHLQWHLVGIEVGWINVIQLVSVVSIEDFAWQSGRWERFHWFHGPLWGFNFLWNTESFFSVSLHDPKLKKIAGKFDEWQHMWEKHRKLDQRQRADVFSRPTQRSYCKTLPGSGAIMKSLDWEHGRTIEAIRLAQENLWKHSREREITYIRDLPGLRPKCAF